MRRAGIVQRRAPTTPAPLDIALWVAHDDSPLIYGYTTAQLAAATVSGPPAFMLEVTGAGGAISPCVLRDGSICFGRTSAWMLLPRKKIVGPRLVEGFGSPRVLLRASVGAGIASSGPVQMPDTDVIFGADTAFARTRLGNPFASQAVITVSGADGISDVHVDPAGNLWKVAYANDFAVRFSAASVAGAGSAVIDKIATGANLDGLTGIALDSAGGAWFSSYEDAELKYYDATAIGALNDTPSNPAPTRTLTSAAFDGVNGIALDRLGNAWVGQYNTSTVVCFTAAQLTAGGAQTPFKTVNLPETAAGAFLPGRIRMGLGHGLFLR